MSKKKEHPLILVFYLDRELMMQRELVEAFTAQINRDIVEREANAMAFFIPTDDKEHIECINPLIATEDEKNKITKLIDDISKSFDIGQGADED